MKKVFALIGILLNFCVISAQSLKIDTLSIDDYKLNTIYLPKELKEISGLEYDEDSFWGFNDSGGNPELYKFNYDTGKIIQTVKIINVKNVDWEEITMNDDYIFIGDFGNNRGIRKDLTVYYIKRSEIPQDSKYVELEAEKLEFYYPEQKEVNLKNRTTNFDTEAMIYHNGKIHLFTKEWTWLGTTHYTIEIKEGKQAAKKIETFQTNYLVTGAYLDDDPTSNTNGLYLIGYTKDGVSLISAFQAPKKDSDIFFSNKIKKFSLPLGFITQLGQTEGISIKKGKIGVICFSAEELKRGEFYAKQALHCIESSYRVEETLQIGTTE